MATLEKSGALQRLIDPFAPTAATAPSEYHLRADWRAWGVPLLVGALGLVISLVGWATNPHQFYFSYLVGWTFCVSLALGALFFVLIQHLTKAKWSLVVRRIAESMLWSFPMLALLGIPILFGMHDLYHWTHEDVIAHDAVIAGKTAYLNIPFFVARLAFYFLIWSVIGYKLYKLSLRDDINPDPLIPAKQRRVSAWGLVVTAVTTAFASYDLLMSLDPHWFSTIFGVYIFSGAFMSIHALIALISITARKARGGLRHVVTKEHYHDLGKMMFAFTVFWTYIAFSQYMLIWYGNIPEETIFYRHRLEHGWELHSAILLICHFIIPFLVLLPRSSKRSIPVLTVMGIWLLTMHWFDLHWIAMPVLHPENAGIHFLDLTSWIGLFGIFVGAVVYRMARHSLVPHNSPYLIESLRFENM
ncbi:MAG: hypothetical protein WED81_07625 [Rhodothermales bacterium]